MTTKKTLREELEDIFTQEMIISFWTHEKCPPNIDGWETKRIKTLEHQKYLHANPLVYKGD